MWELGISPSPDAHIQTEITVIISRSYEKAKTMKSLWPSRSVNNIFDLFKINIHSLYCGFILPNFCQWYF